MGDCTQSLHYVHTRINEYLTVVDTHISYSPIEIGTPRPSVGHLLYLWSTRCRGLARQELCRLSTTLLGWTQCKTRLVAPSYNIYAYVLSFLVSGQSPMSRTRGFSWSVPTLPELTLSALNSAFHHFVSLKDKEDRFSKLPSIQLFHGWDFFKWQHNFCWQVWYILSTTWILYSYLRESGIAW